MKRLEEIKELIEARRKLCITVDKFLAMSKLFDQANRDLGAANSKLESAKKVIEKCGAYAGNPIANKGCRLIARETGDWLKEHK